MQKMSVDDIDKDLKHEKEVKIALMSTLSVIFLVLFALTVAHSQYYHIYLF